MHLFKIEVLVILATICLVIIGGLPKQVNSSSVQPVIIINNQAKSRSYTDLPASIFTHASHEKIYDCSVCHPDLFIEKIGANKINMKENIIGNYCGKCHNGIDARGMSKCDVCHRSLQD